MNVDFPDPFFNDRNLLSVFDLQTNIVQHILIASCVAKIDMIGLKVWIFERTIFTGFFFHKEDLLNQKTLAILQICAKADHAC